MLQTTGGNNLEHAVTNEAVKQRIMHGMSQESGAILEELQVGPTILPEWTRISITARMTDAAEMEKESDVIKVSQLSIKAK